MYRCTMSSEKTTYIQCAKVSATTPLIRYGHNRIVRESALSRVQPPERSIGCCSGSGPMYTNAPYIVSYRPSTCDTRTWHVALPCKSSDAAPVVTSSLPSVVASTDVALTPHTKTYVPSSEKRCVPAMVIKVPPPARPELGSTEAMSGQRRSSASTQSSVAGGQRSAPVHPGTRIEPPSPPSPQACQRSATKSCSRVWERQR
mmetsp:Transcript_41746/g.97727  ORF Transcript_41746/g.97727 Transcript_41746/m.97727 type:complete len:202 (+) Transcript_41746:319-924(+)